MSCPIAFIVWCDMWQCIAQSPATASNSKSRVCPTPTISVTSERHFEGGSRPPSPPVIQNRGPCRWIGWFHIDRLPTRMRTRSPVAATSVSIAGKALLLKVHTSKSVMIDGSGRYVPGCSAQLCSRIA